jgi:hypothetical protein
MVNGGNRVSIVHLLIQFIFRVTFGVALAMSVTPSRMVSSGFYRVHLWVLMGLNTLASLAIITQREPLSQISNAVPIVIGLAVGLSVLSYLGAILWLYEKSGAGRTVLFLITLMGLVAASLLMPRGESTTAAETAWKSVDVVSSGLLLGFTLTAMFLGHWYLNTPTMDLMPLKRLVLLMAGVVLLRGLVSGVGAGFHIHGATVLENQFWIFVALRWLSGLIGVFLLAVLAWYSLQVPNTQSATGILYAGVILAFIGELTSQFLSMNSAYPL